VGRSRRSKEDDGGKGRANLEAAHAHIQRAREQWERAAVDSWEPADPAGCVTFAFYAFENAVVAAAEAVGARWEKKHPFKAELAERLAANRVLTTDVSERLRWLNNVRKDVAYGEPGAELGGVDLEELVSDLEGFIGEVEEVIVTTEEAAEDSEDTS
jgi:hypothetical protein